MSARNRELIGLIPASLLVTAGFAAVFIQRSNVLSNVSLTYGAIFLGLCLAAHLVIRFTLPQRRPLHVPARRRAGQLRDRDGLPDRFRRGAAAGAVVRDRADPVRRRRSSCSATTASSSATATRSSRSRSLILALPRRAGARPVGQRRLPGGAGPRAVRIPARGVRQDRAGHLSGQLPARHPPGARHRRAPDPRA